MRRGTSCLLLACLVTPSVRAQGSEQPLSAPSSSDTEFNPASHEAKMEEIAARARRLAEEGGGKPTANPGHPKSRRRKKRSWLDALGLGGGVGADGKPVPMKVPKLSTEEVLVGVFCIALGGLFLSFAI